MKKRCYQRFVGSFEHLRVLRHCIWQTSPGLLLPAALCPPGKRAPLIVFQGKLLGHIAKSLRFSIPIFWQAAQFWKKELMNGSEVLVLHTHGRESYIGTERITELLLFFICLKIGSFVCGLPLSTMPHPPTPCTINETGKKSTGSAQSHSVAPGGLRRQQRTAKSTCWELHRNHTWWPSQ